MNDELDYEAISRDAREFLEQSTEKEEEQVVQEEAAENENDHLIVDGQDLRNHPEFERLRLDIPWQEGEGGWGYQKKYPEIYGEESYAGENAQKFLKRKHAFKNHILTKKSKKRKLRLTNDALVSEKDVPNIKEQLRLK